MYLDDAEIVAGGFSNTISSAGWEKRLMEFKLADFEDLNRNSSQQKLLGNILYDSEIVQYLDEAFLILKERDTAKASRLMKTIKRTRAKRLRDDLTFMVLRALKKLTSSKKNLIN